MKKLLFVLIPVLLLGSCLPSKKSSESTTSSEPTTTTTTTTSTSTSTSTSSSTSEDPDPEPGDDPAPEIVKQTISQIKTEKKIGHLVKFEATYLRTLTWTNEDLMYFANGTDYIWLRVPYANYTGYLANLYTMKEYTVVGKVAEVNSVVELVFDATIGNKKSVITLGDEYPLSYDESTTPTSVTGISEIKAKSGQIVLNNKGHGAGEIVKFTSQVVQTEYKDANKKAMVLDSDGSTIAVISEKKLVGQDDIGKYYTWIGIISVQTSIPAIMGLSCTYVAHTPEEESHVDVSNATEVLPSNFKNKGLTSSKYDPLNNDDYFKLYKATGYLKDNADITTSYNFGVVDTNTGSLSDNNISTKSVAGFYLVNYTGLDEKDLSYCPAIITDNVDKNVQLTFYFSIRMYDTQNHLWKMFVIEDLIQLVS